MAAHQAVGLLSMLHLHPITILWVEDDKGRRATYSSGFSARDFGLILTGHASVRAILRARRPCQYPRSHRTHRVCSLSLRPEHQRPHELARRQEWSRGTITLERQPASLEEAVAWTKCTVSIGLLQVNSEHAKELHVTVEQLFEPCTNLRPGATLLATVYSATDRVQGEGLPALDTALSYYNSGTPYLGFRNGYVGQGRLNASPP
jgi:Transglycosylase SLT domain